MAKRQIYWSVRSIQDKLDIYTYWIQRNNSINYAEKLEKLFNKAMEITTVYPEAGVATEINNIRFRIVRNYKLIYRITESKIEVITVWDTRRDRESLNFP